MKTTDPARENSPRLGVARLLFVVVLIVLFFLLGQSMVRHRFFRGGRYHTNGSVGQ